MIQWKKGRHLENQQRNKMQRRQYVDYINMCNVEKIRKKSSVRGQHKKTKKLRHTEKEKDYNYKI